MPSLHRVVNHLKYIRSNWMVVVSSFILFLSGGLVAGSLARAGENALACSSNGYNSNYSNYGNDNGYCGNGSQVGYEQPRPSETPCPWWNNSYNCRKVAYETPCPWWNNSYTCARTGQGNYYNSLGSSGNGGAGACQQNCAGNQQPNVPPPQPANQCSNNCGGGAGGGYSGGAQAYPASDNGGYPPVDDGYGGGNGVPPIDDGGGMPPPPPQDQPPIDDNDHHDQPAPSESPQPPVNNNVNNNNSSAVANVVVNPAGVVRDTSPVVRTAPVRTPVIELPETGPADGMLGIVGIGSLVAAGTAYVSSRRELLRTIFKH